MNVTLEELTGWLKQQRWFGGKGVPISKVEVLERIPLQSAPDAEASIVVTRERGAPISFAGDLAARRWVVQLELDVLRAGERTLARDVRLALARDERVWLRGAISAASAGRSFRALLETTARAV